MVKRPGVLPSVRRGGQLQGILERRDRTAGLSVSGLSLPLYYILKALEATFPDVQVLELFTASGIRPLHFSNEVGECQSVNQ